MLTLNQRVAGNPQASQEDSGDGDDEDEDTVRDINNGSQETVALEGQASQTMLAIREQIAQDMWVEYQSYLARHRLN